MAEAQENRYRLDQWLNKCCVFKTRSEATRACESGHVKINTQRAKPASDVKIGDVVEITGAHARKLIVEALPAGNVSKEVARTLYRDETPPPPPKNSDDWFASALKNAPQRERGAGRPTKRDRRQIDKWGR
ncbi:MAG: ribosome-associated heat shock protein Hsp15 [Abditibacteriota bacterium]|nr:ribosome-associated heat shock protein Hsp15 [Abditibacteriota bacterium]